MTVIMMSMPAHAACTSPAGENSQTRFDFAAHKMFICDDTNWIAIPGGANSGFGCVLDGVVVPDGASFDFYSAQSHANCASIMASRACANGTLGGSASYQYASCTNADTTPDAFSFNDVTGAPTSTLTTPAPATVTISGIGASTPVSVSGTGSPQISIAGGAWVTSGTITNGQTLAVRLTSANAGNTARNAVIDVGGVTDSWSVTTAVCASGGASVGGYCWYYGATGQSCGVVCAGKGLTCDQAATRNYAGSDGSDAECQAVLDALGAPADASIMSTPVALGCYYGGAFTERSRGSSATTCAASSGTTNRACVCY